MEKLYVSHLIECPECGNQIQSNTAWVESGCIQSVRYQCHACHATVEIGEGHFDVDWHIDALAYFLMATESSFPSPTTQGCTPEGGVSAYCADDNSKGGAHE
ncbi:hypothetical protein [Marinobacterium stanieri]|uniref:Uncharacterized protein n=1 Tax=Marinobacterium stanieri TaxID=49186 RepID=A0A1N6W5W7_9GAMM|nr:hypothetical protein [Marinobacterium stanieri]SIQ85543.1 hypothetical protein SAMN05421647_1103 [Marinobacterium stanieri]